MAVQKQGVSEYKMIDVGSKTPTHRVCIATGKLIAAEPSIAAIRLGTLPKGNVLPLAEAAGIIAVKKTSELLPLCHPLPIDAAILRFEFEKNAVRVFCEVRAHAKTGVEMEALSGVNAALLCIYDLTKGIDPALELADIHLIEKRGGKSGTWRHPKAETPITAQTSSSQTPSFETFNTAVITLSDRAARGETEDVSGRTLKDALTSLGAIRIHQTLIPDDTPILTKTLHDLIETEKMNLVLTTGGTGVGPRDITPETLFALGGKLVPGFGELIRQSGAQFTPYSYLSRAEAYIVKHTLIICLPGSPKGAKESLDAIQHLIPHTLKIISGANHG
jgi:molybdenum cofactor synthesis domain-containing protein